MEILSERFMTIFTEEFEKLISAKTGWGKNEIMINFHKAAASSAIRYLEEASHETDRG